MDHYPPPPVYASAQPTPGNSNLEMTGQVAVHPSPPPPALARGLPVSQQQLGDDREGHDPNALLVGATVITMLAFLLGTFIPGGYWEHGTAASWDGKVVYHAGDPVMRDLHRPRYWVFRVATWVGVASSMVLTLSLLLRIPADSRHVRWSFAVAYSSLLLTFAVSQTKTHLSLDIIVWVAVLIVSWVITSSNHGEKRARIVAATAAATEQKNLLPASTLLLVMRCWLLLSQPVKLSENYGHERFLFLCGEMFRCKLCGVLLDWNNVLA